MCGYGGFGGGPGFWIFVLLALGVAYFLSRSRFFSDSKTNNSRSDDILEEVKKLRQEVSDLKKNQETKNL